MLLFDDRLLGAVLILHGLNALYLLKTLSKLRLAVRVCTGFIFRRTPHEVGAEVVVANFGGLNCDFLQQGLLGGIRCCSAAELG